MFLSTNNIRRLHVKSPISLCKKICFKYWLCWKFNFWPASSCQPTVALDCVSYKKNFSSISGSQTFELPSKKMLFIFKKEYLFKAKWPAGFLFFIYFVGVESLQIFSLFVHLATFFLTTSKRNQGKKFCDDPHGQTRHFYFIRIRPQVCQDLSLCPYLVIQFI